MYAIIESGGRQYKVEPGTTLQVNKLKAEPGSEVTLERVLLVADGDTVTVGNPNVSDAKVVATVVKQKRDKKIIVFKKRRKKGYKKTQGHRQYITELKVKEIIKN